MGESILGAPLTPPLHLTFVRHSLHICVNIQVEPIIRTFFWAGVQFAKSLYKSLLFLSSLRFFVDKVHGAVAGGEAWGEADIGPALRFATFARLALPCQAFHTFVPAPPCHKGCSVAKGSPRALEFTVNYNFWGESGHFWGVSMLSSLFAFVCHLCYRWATQTIQTTCTYNIS